jgi:hypothetical protein
MFAAAALFWPTNSHRSYSNTPDAAVTSCAKGTSPLNDQQSCFSFWRHQVQTSAWRLVTLAEFVSRFRAAAPNGVLHLLTDSSLSNLHIILTASFNDDDDHHDHDIDVTTHLCFVFSVTVVLFCSDINWLITTLPQNWPSVIGTLICEGVELERWERLVWTVS